MSGVCRIPRTTLTMAVVITREVEAPGLPVPMTVSMEMSMGVGMGVMTTPSATGQLGFVRV